MKPNSLEQGNEKAVDIWRKFKTCGEGATITDLLQIISSFGGTENDYEKVIQILIIDNRLNPKE